MARLQVCMAISLPFPEISVMYLTGLAIVTEQPVWPINLIPQAHATCGFRNCSHRSLLRISTSDMSLVLHPAASFLRPLKIFFSFSSALSSQLFLVNLIALLVDFKLHRLFCRS
ncbi:hypothetical protein SISSUDRAFT_395550 [Sistotremastrum suecicum HHB10207 ss-3]|uniref:Uncharacterized protein n=1 Tax=Sistotremastrum suecicum HHB10207 ss-3 TaxID=1314776 RepID=A0A165YV09_9AGAM|nr:hypothetical protein SISSUDRAFT_395550 [Sistotremastrum suecicum HHB10207 ss-3]